MQNELLIISEDSKIKTLDLLNVSPGSIKEAASDASLVILGGLGFSGLNKRFNATQGIYRGAVLTLEEDAKRSLEFEKAYRKVNDALETSKVICLTHNPKSDWTNDAYNRNWIYVSGHTHQNFRCVNSNKTVYSNNQIGYYARGVALKCFEIDPSDFSQMQFPEN
ncbi:MAG: hypothetical protein LBC41_05070 [Clostridiales bacterium]|nr:hypothetical protein [Clostridiales bacterium]